MLTLNGEEFTIGRAKFSDGPHEEEPTAKIYIKIIPGELDVPILAQLDTGSPWSILACELAQEMGLLNGAGVETKLRTKDGPQVGHLVRVPLTIPADDGQGESLELREAPFFVSENWPRGKHFIGYTGLIEVIRIAVDAQENYFYFGLSGAEA